MKILVVSDLHLEHGTAYAVPDNATFDAVILAGDVQTPGTRGVLWAQRSSTFGGKPVVLVAGNHEFYRTEHAAELASMRDAAKGSNVHLLDRSTVDILGVRFLGCTLWTDFQLPIWSATDPSGEVDVGRAIEESNLYLNDFRMIELDTDVRSSLRTGLTRRLLRAEDTLAWHAIERDWLRREMAHTEEEIPVVVVTHHAPSRGSVAARYKADWLTPSFVSELPADMFRRPRVWVHGHTHSPFDYMVRGCRVVSNPRGYRLSDGSFENPRFNPGLIIDIPQSGERSGGDEGGSRRSGQGAR